MNNVIKKIVNIMFSSISVRVNTNTVKKLIPMIIQFFFSDIFFKFALLVFFGFYSMHPLFFNFMLLKDYYVHFFFMLLLILPLIYILFLVSLQAYYAYNFTILLKNSLLVFIFIYTLMYIVLCYQLLNIDITLLSQNYYYFFQESSFYFGESNGSYFNLPALFNIINISDINIPLQFIFYIDILGILFIGLGMLLIFLCILFLWPTFELEKNIILYVSQLLLLLTQLQITFTAANLLTFFVAFESLLIPIIIMISIWGSPNRRQANNYLVFYTMVSAVPMLLAIIYINQKYGNLTISYLMTVVSWTWNEQFWLWCAFFFAFAVKTPMVPVHIWLPKAHVDAPTVGSVILAGLLLKVGLVGFIRISLPLFPEATHFFAPYVSALATVGVLYASLITLRQIDIKRIIAYSSVAHINMAVVSLCSLNPLGLYGSIFLILSHGLIASGLFFLVGFLYNRFHVRNVSYFGGLATIMPIITVVFFLFSLANIAFPFTSGFIGEFLLLLGITSTNFFLGFLNAFSMLVTTAYTMLLFGRVFLGELKFQFQQSVQQLLYTKSFNNSNTSFLLRRFSIYDLYYYEFIIVFTLLVLIFVLGIYPQVLLNLLFKSSNLYLICAYL